MSKHLVSWNRPILMTIGKNALKLEGEFLYLSKCGRFQIRKMKFSSGRGNFNNVEYKVTDLTTGKTCTCDTLADAKLHADWEIDPNFEG